MSVFERTFARCMGLAVSGDAQSLALAMHYQIYRFDDVLEPGRTTPEGYETVVIPAGGTLLQRRAPGKDPRQGAAAHPATPGQPPLMQVAAG